MFTTFAKKIHGIKSSVSQNEHIQLFNHKDSFTVLRKGQICLSYAAFTHAGLTTRDRTKNFYKDIFVLSRSRVISFIKIESNTSCLKLQTWNLSFKTWKYVFINVRFHSFVKTITCKRSIAINATMQLSVCNSLVKLPSAEQTIPRHNVFPKVCSFAHLFFKLPRPGDSEVSICGLRVKLLPVTTQHSDCQGHNDANRKSHFVNQILGRQNLSIILNKPGDSL